MRTGQDTEFNAGRGPKGYKGLDMLGLTGEDYSEDIRFFGSLEDRGRVQRVVLRLPIEVVEWVVENVVFISLSGIAGLATRIPVAPSDDRQELLIVSIAGDSNETEERQEFRIAHELAHLRLNHPDYMGGELYERCEQEADNLANEWGFSGRSNRVTT